MGLGCSSYDGGRRVTTWKGDKNLVGKSQQGPLGTREAGERSSESLGLSWPNLLRSDSRIVGSLKMPEINGIVPDGYQPAIRPGNTLENI